MIKLPQNVVVYLGLIAWAIVILKAYLVPITTDEATTFTDYVLFGDFIPPFAKWDANNHILNSFLTFCSFKIFGSHAFSLRLPNVLFFGLLIYQTHVFAQRYLGSILLKVALAAMVFYSLASLELFSLSRGYGVSMALLIWFLNTSVAQYENPNKSPTKTLIIGFLMASANLNLLPIYVGIMGMVFLKRILEKRVLLFPLLTFGVLTLVLLLIGLKLNDKGKLYYGVTEFLQNTIGVSSIKFTGTNYLKWYYIPLIIGSLTSLVLALIKKRIWSGELLIPFFVLIALAAPLLQRLLLNSLYPFERTFAHAFILLPFVFLAGVQKLSFRQGVIQLTTLVYACLIPVFCLSAVDLNRSALWPHLILPGGVFEVLSKFQKEENRAPLVLGNYTSITTWQYENYRNASGVPIFQLKEFDEESKYMADYFLVDTSLIDSYTALGSKEFYLSKESDLALIRNTPREEELINTKNTAFDLPSTAEFAKLIDTNIVFDRSCAVRVDVEMDLTIPKTTSEFFIVIKNNEAQYYHQENLARFQTKESLFTKGLFKISVPVKVKPDGPIKVTLWNPERQEFDLNRAKVNVTAIL